MKNTLLINIIYNIYACLYISFFFILQRIYSAVYTNTITMNFDNPFSVVITIDSLKATASNIHVVPSHWIYNDVLYFPPSKLGKTHIESLIRNGRHAAVDLKWKKYAYVLRKSFKNYDDADKYATLKQKSDDTDSDAHDQILKNLQSKQLVINSKPKQTKGKRILSFFKSLHQFLIHRFF